MKVNFRLNNLLTVELDGENQRDLFEKLAAVQEVFGNDTCGKCKSTDLKFVVRENDGNKYYELHCKKCTARFSFGAHKQTLTLFPKRKDGDNWLPDGGWTKWDKEKKIRV